MQTQLIGSTSPLQTTIPIIRIIRCMVQDRLHNGLEGSMTVVIIASSQEVLTEFING